MEDGEPFRDLNNENERKVYDYASKIGLLRGKLRVIQHLLEMVESDNNRIQMLVNKALKAADEGLLISIDDPKDK